MKQPPFPTKDDLVAGYIAMERASHGSAEREETFWSFMLMDELIEQFPREALEVIKLILEADTSGEVVGALAAGPIEDLLSRHGVEIIDAIENEAINNPKFNYALGGVWRSESVPEVWDRVVAVRNTEW